MSKQDQIRQAIVDCYLEAINQVAPGETAPNFDNWAYTDADEEHVKNQLGVSCEEIAEVWASEQLGLPQMFCLAEERVEELALQRVASQLDAVRKDLGPGERLCYDDEGEATVESVRGAQEALEWLLEVEDLETIATSDALSGALQIHDENGFVRTWTSA